MIFENYILDSEHNIDSIKTELKYRIDVLKKLVQRPFNISIKELEMLAQTLSISGGHNFESRYGNIDISFSHSELMRAIEKNFYDSVRYLFYRYKFKKYPTLKILDDFPIVLAIEPSSKCNLKCIMCFQANSTFQKSHQSSGMMDIELYKKILSEASKHNLASIVFASRGEPLLHPQIDKMILMAHEAGVMDIKLNTNATLLTEELSHRLLRTPLSTIVFSVDSVNEETYRKIRGANLRKVLTNIINFHQIRKNKFSNSKIRTRVAMVLVKMKEINQFLEIENAKNYWTHIVDEFSYKTENDFRNIYEEQSTHKDLNPCSLLWERLYIWHDGTINPCDIDHMSLLSLGSIAKGDTISSVWNADKIRMLREQHLQNREHCPNPCSRCIGY